MAGNGHAARLHRVLVLPVSGARAMEQYPTVLFHLLDEVSYFHLNIKFLSSYLIHWIAGAAPRTCYREFLGMNILFIGDIFGAPGRRIVADHLQDMIQAN